MLQRFQHIRSRECIDRRLRDKYDDVLRKFVEEVNAVDLLFNQQRSRPPVALNLPKTAGAIQWARALFQRIKVRLERQTLLSRLFSLILERQPTFPFFPSSSFSPTLPQLSRTRSCAFRSDRDFLIARPAKPPASAIWRLADRFGPTKSSCTRTGV